MLKKTPGIVLIDEVDLYLHSQWQQTILNDLRTIFPNIQFIVSLHGAAMINSVTSEQIRILDNGKIRKQKKNQERFYIELYRSGNKDSKDKAICYFFDTYENFIKQQIQQFYPTYKNKYFDDLLSSGKLGLLEALQKYDPDKGAFTTCSKPYIRYELTRFLCEIVAQN